MILTGPKIPPKNSTELSSLVKEFQNWSAEVPHGEAKGATALDAKFKMLHFSSGGQSTATCRHLWKGAVTVLTSLALAAALANGI